MRGPLRWTVRVRLEQLDGVAVRVFHEHLLATDATDDVVAELHPRPSKSLDGGLQVLDLDNDTIPPARLRLAAVPPEKPPSIFRTRPLTRGTGPPNCCLAAF